MKPEGKMTYVLVSISSLYCITFVTPKKRREYSQTLFIQTNKTPDTS